MQNPCVLHIVFGNPWHQHGHAVDIRLAADNADFEKFDLVLAMDKHNVSELLTICPPHLTEKIVLFLDFADNFEENEVPDPYYGGAGGFKLVLDMVEDASDGLLAKLN